MSQRFALPFSLLSSVVAAALASVTVADTDTVTPAVTTGTIPFPDPTYPFLWVPYVVLFVIILAVFGVSFARYHAVHRKIRLARVETVEHHRIGRIRSPDTSLTEATILFSPTRLPMYARPIDVKQVLASIYREDRMQLLSPEGRTRTRGHGRAARGRTGG